MQHNLLYNEQVPAGHVFGGRLIHIKEYFPPLLYLPDFLTQEGGHAFSPLQMMGELLL
jgi:hypothetical protein